jgi:hypothetical protein
MRFPDGPGNRWELALADTSGMFVEIRFTVGGNEYA